MKSDVIAKPAMAVGTFTTVPSAAPDAHDAAHVSYTQRLSARASCADHGAPDASLLSVMPYASSV